MSKWQTVPKLPQAHHYIDVEWRWLERSLISFPARGGLDLDPPFQRAHVWSRAQQVAYVEYVLRGGEVGKALTWNASSWPEDDGKPVVLVDGKQRLEAVRAFLRGDFLAHGMRYEAGDLLGLDCRFHWWVCCLATEAELLELYLNINAGGTPHTAEELQRVTVMLEKARRTSPRDRVHRRP